MNFRLELTTMDSQVTETDLLSVYALFPRKGPGKQDGLKALRKSVKTRTDLDDCLRAVKAFVAAHQGKSKEYIRHFDRWARSWRDWLEVELTGSITPLGNYTPSPDGLWANSKTVRVKATPPQAIDPISPEEARRFAAEQLERLKKGGA